VTKNFKLVEREMIKLLKIYLILSFIVASLSSCTAIKAIKLVNSGEMVVNNQPDSVIPFTHKFHPILIKAKLNHSKKEYTFMVDTGALTLISERVAKELNLPKGIEVNAGGTGGNSKAINLVKLDSIIVGNMEVKNCATGVTDFQHLLPQKIAGILGSNFLRHFKITINYQQKEIILLQDTKAVVIQGEEIKIPFETDMKSGFAPVVECVLDGGRKVNGLIDTGFPGFMAIPVSIIRKSKSFHNGSAVISNGSMSGGMFGMGEKESYALRFNRVKIGDLKLLDIPSASHSAENNQVLLGNKLLEKYIVTINYPAKEMTLKPRGIPFETNIPSYGVALTKNDKKTIVSGVWLNSIADRKGLKIGDEIIKVNSIETSTISSMLELMVIFMDEKKNSIEIEFKNKEERKVVVLQKDNLLPVLE
jgi:predicted aspartyl protease